MMNLSKFIKGTTSIGELEKLPNRYIQTIYKQYVDSMNDPKAQDAMAAEQLAEAIGG